MSERSDYGPDRFRSDFDVSRETFDRLTVLADELCRWQRTINLVGPDTLGDIWKRHILDSAQLIHFIPGDARHLLDMGSGAGFPGLVLAIMMQDRGLQDIKLVEAHARKSAFLRHILRITGVRATVVNSRIELLEPSPMDVITSRALAPVDRLLQLAAPFCAGHTRCLFLKGRNVASELTEASKCWNINYSSHASLSEAGGTVLLIKDFDRVSSPIE